MIQYLQKLLLFKGHQTFAVAPSAYRPSVNVLLCHRRPTKIKTPPHGRCSHGSIQEATERYGNR